MPGENLAVVRVIDGCTKEEIRDSIKLKLKEGYCGVATYATHPQCCLDLQELIRKAKLMSGDLRREEFQNGNLLSNEVLETLLPPAGIPDTVVPLELWKYHAVGRISPWINVDSEDPYVRLISERALKEELRYFSYLDLTAMLVSLRGPNHGNLSRLIRKHYCHFCYPYTVWVEIPIVAPKPSLFDSISYGSDDGSNGCDFRPADSWEWFQAFRMGFENDYVRAVLELTPELPERSMIDRWKGETLAAVKFDTQMFTVNTNTGLPVLPDAYQQLAKELYAVVSCAIVDGLTWHVRPDVVISDTTATDSSSSSSSTPASDPAWCIYYEHLNQLWCQILPTIKTVLEDAADRPVLPLRRCLRDGFTEPEINKTFERDRVKYDEYCLAINLAVAAKTQILSTPLIIMILGAGRGALVQLAYESLIEREVTKFKLYAVEKNPNSVLMLRKRNESEWKKEVEVICSDIRYFISTEKADIVISDFFGSFGDDKLSPEYLDSALHLMKEDCISIPESYSSYIAPLHSPYLFDETVNLEICPKKKESLFKRHRMVKSARRFNIADPKLLFTFHHPNFNRLTNERFQELEFFARESAEVMGFIGYFTVKLFGNIELSTVPDTYTRGTSDYLPILFQIAHPVFVKKGQKIRLRFWRCVNERQLWYEWQLMEPTLLPVSNLEGKIFAIPLLQILT